MERIQLTKNIINNDLKERKKRYPFMIIIALVLICCGTYEVFKNLDKGSIILIVFPCVAILFGLICLVHSIKEEFIINSRYSIGEGIIEKDFYDQSREISKVTITGLKGVIICPSNLSVGQSVYVVYYKNNAIMCYDKNKYYV